jgi:hypothetical protein
MGKTRGQKGHKNDDWNQVREDATRVIANDFRSHLKETPLPSSILKKPHVKSLIMANSSAREYRLHGYFVSSR